MNIVRENLEDGTTLLKATVAEADYNEAVARPTCRDSARAWCP